MGPSIKDVRTLGEEEVEEGSGKSGQMRTGGGGGWLAKCGRPLGKKIMATIFVKFTHNLAVCLYIKFSFCLYSLENVWNAM